MGNDLYRELGVSPSATQEEIRKAYRKLAAQYHPDRNGGDAKAETRFKAVNNAYQVLNEPKKRALYDEFGEMGLREGFNERTARAYKRAASVGGAADFLAGGRGLGDLVGEVFRAARGTAKGRDVSGEVEVDFEAAIRGTTVSVRVPNVHGEVNVRVPPGAGTGDKLRVAGRGEPGRGNGAAGDLLLSVVVRPHPHFTRDGLDLTLDCPITVEEAVDGAKIKVPTPQGVVSLTVPEGAQSGQLVRLKGRGVQRKDKVGDLYVRFLIAMPQPRHLSGSELKRMREAAKTLSELTADNLRDAIRL